MHVARANNITAAEFDFGEVMRTGGYIRCNLSSRSILSRMYTLRRTARLAQARGSLAAQRECERPRNSLRFACVRRIITLMF